MKNWYQENYSPTLSEYNKDKISNFNSYLEYDNLTIDNMYDNLKSFDDIGKFGWNTVRGWMHDKGVYFLPTMEFIDWILDELFPEEKYDDEYFNKNKVIEIGSGYGLLARSLGIKATDNKLQQRNPEVMAYYTLAGQPLIKYPKDVELRDANMAVKYYKPDTIIGSYITFGSKDVKVCSELGASGYGPDMNELYNLVNRVILIGNTGIQAHVNNPILKFQHREYLPDELPGIITRGNPINNRVWVWEK